MPVPTMLDFQITENFWYHEFLVSDKFPELAAKLAPDAFAVRNICFLCVTILQPARDRFGYIGIESGFRSPELNVAVGGSEASLHMIGAAADPSPAKLGLIEDMFYWMREKLRGKYSQLIWYPEKKIIHAGLIQPGIVPFWQIKEGGKVVKSGWPL